MKPGRSLAIALVAATTLPCWGCGLAPHSFRKVQDTAPLVRARAVGLGRSQPDSQVVPALIARLDDEDAVVRMTANEELRQRTGQDFGFVPWASAEERSAAVARWRSWLTGPAAPAGSTQSPHVTTAPAVTASPQAAKRSARRRRRRAKDQPPAAIVPPAPPATENVPS